jgi:hypothetical protein
MRASPRYDESASAARSHRTEVQDKVIRRGMTGVEMAVRAANKAERELNAESRRTAESQCGTTITLAMRPNAVITELADGWLEAP